MATTSDDLRNFSQFVMQQIGELDDSSSRLLELFDLWLQQNPSKEAVQEDVAAISASIEDFLSGERGTPAADHSAELRARYRIDERSALPFAESKGS